MVIKICMQCDGLKYLDETHIKKHGDEIHMQCHGLKYLDETHIKKHGDEIPMQSLYQSIWIKFSEKTPPASGF